MINQRLRQGATLEVIFIGIGLGIFWLPYFDGLFSRSIMPYWLPPFVWLIGIYIAGRGVALLSKRSIRVVLSLVTLFNLFGIAVFLILASQCWVQSDLADVPGASGGAFAVWGGTALPIISGCLFLYLVWLLCELVYLLRRKTWRLGWTFLSIPLLWAIAFYYDNIHHGI